MHRSTSFGMERTRVPGDGVVTGHGTVGGRPVCVFSQDFTVFGGSLGEVYGEKICKVMDLAVKIGAPIVGINEGAGARIQEGVVSLGLYGEIFRRNVHASGVIPQISLIMGACAGGHVYSPALTDFTIMVDEGSHMFVTGPDVIKTVTGEDVTFEELGGARVHNSRSGNAHYLAQDEDDALDYARALLSYLPQNNLDDRTPFEFPVDLEIGAGDLALDTLVPDSPNQPYDMHEVIAALLDDGEFLEVQALFAPNIVVGFGCVEGRSVGVVATSHAAGRHAGHRRLGEGGPVRTHLRRVRHPGADARGRARIPARHGTGVERHHPPGGQAPVRLRRGHGPAGHGHHPEGVRRSL